MFKRTRFTTITPLPPNITRQVVIDFLHDHQEMIDLNPLVKERHPIAAPAHAEPEERDCVWYSLTDKISYLPGGLYTGDVTYTCAFNDLRNGLQTHCYAPAGLTIRDKWTINGSLPDEPSEPIELGIGAPTTGLYIREDVDMRCNVLLTTFVKRTLKKSHAALIERLKYKAQISSGGVPPPPPPPQQQASMIVTTGNKLEVDAPPSVVSAGSASSYGTEPGTGSTAGSISSAASSGGGTSWGTSPSGMGISAQTLQHYEQQFQPRTSSPMTYPQQHQQTHKRHHSGSWQSSPQYNYGHTAPSLQPPQATHWQPQPQPSPQHLNQQLPYPVTPQQRQLHPSFPPSGHASSHLQPKVDQNRRSPSPRSWHDFPSERSGRMVQQQRELNIQLPLQPPPAPGGKQSQGHHNDSPMGATLRGPFMLADVP